jgi:hypothetical protein
MRKTTRRYIIVAIAVLAIVSVWCLIPAGAETPAATDTLRTTGISDAATPLSARSDGASPIAGSSDGSTAADPTTASDIQADADSGAPDSSPGTAAPSGVQDRYQTDPVPTGKPKPQEPQEVQSDAAKIYSCTFSIECGTILSNWDKLVSSKQGIVPSNGVILAPRTVTFSEGESVFDVLLRETRNSGIHMEFVNTPLYNSAYIEGIANIYEFDCGELSGWMYSVNGWFPNYGSGRYVLQAGDVVEWHYTCSLGRDFGVGF